MASLSSSSMDADRMRDLHALMTWLRTFPRIEEKYDECQDVVQLLQDKEMATAILFVADEVCDVSMACESCKKDTETIWKTISTIVVTKMPQLASHLEDNATVSVAELHAFLLSSLVCFAVSESCVHRRMYIERIMALPSHCQQVLMMIIEKGQTTVAGSPPATDETKVTPQKRSGSKRNLEETSSDDEKQSATSERSAKRPSSDDRSVGNNKSWDADDSFVSASVLPGHTPQQRRKSRLSVESLFSPTTIDSTLENLVTDLRKQNESLKQELAASQQREAELGQKMEEAQVSFRKEMMKLESSSLQREEDAREAHKQEAAALQVQLEEYKAALETEQRAHQELESVRDEMDLLQHTKTKLSETEEKLRICRERMEQLSDVKEALTREEQAHSTSVEECLRLQNELKTLQPLRRQLEDYKTRAVEAEVKLTECQAELKRMEQVTGSLSSAQKEIMAGAKLHKEEAEQLRRRLLEEGEAPEEGPGVGEGLSELNPEVMEEMARLRNENIQLKAFAEAREDDAVQMLNERLEDSQRLSDRFKDQYISTKSELEQTQRELQESSKQVAELENEMQDLTENLDKLGQELDDCKTQLSTSQDDLARTTQLLEEVKMREETLRNDVERLSKELSDSNDLASDRLELLETTKGELEDTAASLRESRQQEQQLQKQVAEWTEKTTDVETALSEREAQLKQTKEALEEESASLSASLQREAVLKDTATGLAKANQDLQEKIEEGVRSTEAALLQATQEAQRAEAQLRKEHAQEIVSIKQAEEEERDKLIRKGKGMLKEAKARAMEELANVEDQLQSAEADLAELQKQAKEYEAKTKKQLREYKKKLGLASTRIDGLTQSNDTMEDTIREMERERFKLQEENERFRRQLGGRFGADGKVQNQLETLRNEFDVILEENRGLKKEIEKMGDQPSSGLASLSEVTEAGQSSYTRGGISGSTLSQLRKEYDQTIDALNDSKRELVMKHTAAMTDVQKAEQRAWESDQQVQALKEELTSLKLKLQRLQRTSEGSGEYHDAICESFECNATKENVLSQEGSILYDSKSQAAAQDAPSSEQNSDAMLLDLSCSDDKSTLPLAESTNDSRVDTETSKPKVSAYDFPPAHEAKRRASRDDLFKPVPSLMESAISSSQSSAPDGDAQPECKQS